MGAQESRSQQEADNDSDSPDSDATTQDDYYTILEVDENATADEIRVSSFFFSLFAITARKRSRLFFFCAVMDNDGFVVVAAASRSL